MRWLRYPVAFLLDLRAAGETPQEIVAEYPDLETDDLRAVMAYAARAVRTKRVVTFVA